MADDAAAPGQGGFVPGGATPLAAADGCVECAPTLVDESVHVEVDNLVVAIAPPLRCLLCTGLTIRGLARCLIAHLTRRHKGHVLTPSVCEVLRGLERGGAMRAFSGRDACDAMQRSRPGLRTFEAFPAPRRRPAGCLQDFLPAGLPEELRDDFLARVRRLLWPLLCTSPWTSARSTRAWWARF